MKPPNNRKRKAKEDSHLDSFNSPAVTENTSICTIKRKRGRPRKKPIDSISGKPKAKRGRPAKCVDQPLPQQGISCKPPENEEVKPKTITTFEVPSIPCGTCEDNSIQEKMQLDSSLEYGWNRAMMKYSPLENINVSPIKTFEGPAKPPRFPETKFDKRFKLFNMDNILIVGYIWIVNMSENFYYDNSLILISRYIKSNKKLKQVLIANYSLNEFENTKNRLKNVVILGEGTFGEVFKATDSLTGQNIAIKYIKESKISKISDQFKAYLTYIRERNYLIQSKASPFVCQILRGYSERNMNGVFLVFELCISDLNVFLGNVLELVIVDPSSILALKTDFHYSNYCKQLKTKIGFDYQELVPIYIFECLAMLDFLAKCNIIHRDIKPENIMIAENLHLKLTDFGVIYNTFFISDDSQINVLKNGNLNKILSSKQQTDFTGTTFYFDLEYNYQLVKRRYSTRQFKNLMKNTKLRVDIDNSPYDPCFLFDTWSMGMVCIYILVFGEQINDFMAFEDKSISKKYKMSQTCFLFNNLNLFLSESNFEDFMVRGLHHFLKHSKFIGLTDFLLTLLNPRQTRGIDNTTEKSVRILNDVQQMAYLDIDKVAVNVDIFKQMHLTPHNVFMLNINPAVHTFIKKKDAEVETRKIFKDYNSYLSELKQKEDQLVNFAICPGTDLNLI